MRQAMRDCYSACQGAEAALFNALTVFPGLPIAQHLQIPCMAAYLQPIEPTRAFSAILFPALPPWLGIARSPYNLLTGRVPDSMRWRFLRKPIQAEAHALFGVPSNSIRNPS